MVPADTSTSAEWTYPPFQGHYDGDYVWGRGSEDDKSNLIAMLTAIDCLLECGFEPTRTLILSVGFDEEGGAEQSYGARCLAELLLKRYGKDGIELIVRGSVMPPCHPAYRGVVRRRHCRDREPLRHEFCTAGDGGEGIRGCFGVGQCAGRSLIDAAGSYWE